MYIQLTNTNTFTSVSIYIYTHTICIDIYIYIYCIHKTSPCGPSEKLRRRAFATKGSWFRFRGDVGNHGTRTALTTFGVYMGVPENRGTPFGDPYNQDPTI